MRIRKISFVALVAVAAGLSLTACGGGNDSSTADASSPSASVTQDAAGSGGSSGSTASPSANGKGVSATSDSGSGSSGSGSSGSGSSGSGGGGACQTADLSFSHSFGMGEGEVLINLTNHGSGTCTLHGFPGVDLKGKDGTISAARTHLAAPDVTLTPGQATNFTLHFPPNNTGGSGVTFTSLVVTPPNETHSHTMDLAINLPVSDTATSAVTVDPVGAGK